MKPGRPFLPFGVSTLLTGLFEMMPSFSKYLQYVLSDDIFRFTVLAELPISISETSRK